MGLLIVGVKHSAKANNVMVVVKTDYHQHIYRYCHVQCSPGQLASLHAVRLFQTLPDGKTTGVLAGASLVFFAYVGFDAVSTAAEEAKNPQRDLLLASLPHWLFVRLSIL